MLRMNNIVYLITGILLLVLAFLFGIFINNNSTMRMNINYIIGGILLLLLIILFGFFFNNISVYFFGGQNAANPKGHF